MKLLIYLALVFISFLIEQSYNLCQNQPLYTMFISIIHHIFSIYLYIGTFIFDFYIFNIIIVILTIIGWKLYNDRCFLSIYYNKLCDIPEEVYFHDIINLMYELLLLKNLHYYILMMVLLYNFYFLYVAKKV